MFDKIIYDIYYYSEDVNKCINSAEKGFKIWSTKSIACRMQVLSKFASILGCNRYVLYIKLSKNLYIYIYMYVCL